MKIAAQSLAAVVAVSNLATFAQAQSEVTVGIPGLFQLNLTIPKEIDDIFGKYFEGFDINNTTEFDYEGLFVELGQYVGQGLDNFTLPPELQELFGLEEFENVDFTFGGNCSICDSHDVTLDGTIDGLWCQDWDVVARLGVMDGSPQCDLLRVAAAERCGCPVPDVNKGKTCPICPENEEPTGYELGNGTVGVTCFDLLAAPAVDGDETCRTVENFVGKCACQAITGNSFEGVPSELSAFFSAGKMQSVSMVVAAGSVLGAFFSMM